MPEVAFNGSSTSPSTKSGHVTYDIEVWDDMDSSWRYSGRGSTSALITSSGVSASSTSVFINGHRAVTVGDSVPEAWVASPPVPNNTYYYRYYNVYPASSGSGMGRVSVGSSRTFVNGKALAYRGSSVQTCLATQSMITSGSSNVYVN